MDVRTQQKTGDAVLCPVLQAHRLASRIQRTVPNYGDITTLNTIHITGQTVSISSAYLICLIRQSCLSCGSKTTFGFHPRDISPCDRAEPWHYS
jgi:hypothetical protein